MRAITYKEQRGHYYVTCLKCGNTRQERIPDQAAPEYVHNPGNPIMGLCLNCNHGIGAGNISLAPYAVAAWPRPEEDGARREEWPEPWATWRKVAHGFRDKAAAVDRDDLEHDTVVRLAEVTAKRGEPLTPPAMTRVASYVTAEYWRRLKQERKITSLNIEIEDGEGDTTQLWETIADDKALDVQAWADSRAWLLGCPERLLQIAAKRVNGRALDDNERQYLWYYRRREVKQLSLI